MTKLNDEAFEVELTNAELVAVSGGFIGETFSNNAMSETVSNQENRAPICFTARESTSGYSHCIEQS
jgi:hypothetical protein